MKLVIYISLTSLLFLGCASQEPDIHFEKPEIQIPKKPPEAKKNKGSLYSMQGTSLFADKKDLQIGDIIQIIIDEDTTSKTNNKRELSSDRSTSLGGGTFTSGGSGVVGKVANELNRNLGVGFGTNSSSDDKGSVKSLGAWGGDFVLVTKRAGFEDYFKQKGYNIIVPFREMILS